MSLLDTASLIVTPNGYKEGTLYSVIPSDGSGDMSVVRATTATRVNSAGLVELVPYNLLSYSEQFANAFWSIYQVAIASNSTIAPNGTLTADTITNNLNATASIYVTGIQNFGKNTFSIYFKKGTHDVVFIEAGNATYNVAYFNLITETIVSSSGFSNVTMENVGNGWIRCYGTFFDTGSTVFVGFGNANGTAGNTSFVWGAQLNEGTIKDYQKTETRLNIPRLDYSNGTCPSLLVEPQRTNLLTYSSSFDNVAWSKIDGNGGSTPIITANYGVSPDGTQNAERIQLARTNATNSYSYVFQWIPTTVGQSYTWSVWLKSLSGTPSIALSLNGSYTNIVTLTNEWERYEFTATAVSTSIEATFILYQGVPSTSLSADFLAYGFQAEQGSYTTSYIPTTSASVTRNADVVSKTGISSLIGQTEGTLFVDFYNYGNTLLASNVISSINAGDYGNGVWIEIYNGQLYGNVFEAYAAQFQPNAGTISVGRHKAAIAYKANDLVFYVDGVQIATDTSATVPSCSRVDIGTVGTSTTPQELGVNASALWKTRLTNTQLAQLTTI